jgi:hypothetical protein
MKLDGKSTQDLLVLQREIEEDPKNKEVDSVYLYNPKARKKLDAITLQITHNLKEDKKKRGIYVNESGYSGRGKNR